MAVMEGFGNDTRFAAQAAAAIKGDKFTLIDVGCSGGIDSIWRIFGDKLNAFGFDPNLHECERLQKLESNEHVHYVPGFVGINADHPFAKKKAGRPHIERTPWSRLSVQRTLELRQADIERMSTDEKTQMNQWGQVSLADPTNPIILPEFFKANGICDIDFIKIDTDGPDFDVLQTLADALREYHVLGVGLEVNWIGSDSETDHTFHNTDRFMRNAGFDLFNVTVRRYSVRALPDRYALTIPAQTNVGRPLQGDAIYMRDICAPENAELADQLTSSKILKAAGLMALANLPDHAAEILVHFRTRLQAICNVNELLDSLVIQINPNVRLNYDEYIAAFERDESIFYPG
jgi:hypothetical protein